MINGFVLLKLPTAEAAALALPDGEAADRLHLTLVGITGEEMTIEHLSNRLEQWAGDHPPLSGEITGFGVFNEGSDGKPVLYATFDSPALPEFRQALADWLVESGYELKQDYGFVSHITLKYLDGEPTKADIPELPPLKITFSQLIYSQKREDDDSEFDLYPFNLNSKEVSMPNDEKEDAAQVDGESETKAASEPDSPSSLAESGGESSETNGEALDGPALKAEIDPDQGEVTPPNYHEATDGANRCGACGFFDGGHCRNYEIPVEVGFVCDDWIKSDTPYGEGATKAAAKETPDAAEGEKPTPVEAEIKAGARNNTADAKRIQLLHDTAAELGATCKSDANKFTFTKGWSLNERQQQVIYAWEQKRQPGYPRDILDDAVIIARDGGLFSYPYTMNGNDLTFGEPTPVAVRYIPENKAFNIQDPDFAIKALREVEDGLIVGGPLVLWGSPREKDLSGDYFIKSTELWLDLYPKAPALFHHGLDQAVGLSVVGHRIKARLDDVGAWVETWLDKRSQYLKMIRPLLEAKALFYSPGSASHLVRRTDDGCLKAFPVIEDTLTPTPMQHRLLPLEQIKSAYRVLGLDDPFGQAQPAAEEPVAVTSTPVASVKAALLDEMLKLDGLGEKYEILV